MATNPSNTVYKELLLPQPRDQVWRALTTPETLARWMYPNDFEPRLGHRFTFQVPAKPEAEFPGLTVRCEVLECEPPQRLVFSWSAGGAVEDTRVSFQLSPHEAGTRLLFEHSGFDLSQPFGRQALKGAGYGWGAMLDALSTLLNESVKP